MADPTPSPDELVARALVTLVKPLQKTAHVESILPSFMDLSFADYYVPVMFAYRLASNSDAAYSQAINQIKGGLEKVLGLFFSFAGRWTIGGSRGRLLLCNDEGFPFIEAFLDKEMDDEVHFDLEFDAIPELHGYRYVGMDFKALKQRMPADGQPPAFVQVTRFNCGGLVVAVTFNHVHTDLNGFFTFITAWSDLSRGNEVALKEDSNREKVNVPALQGVDRNLSEKGSDGGDEPYSSLPWVTKSWEVTASAIKSVKQEAKENKNGPGFVSTQDCIAAHVWGSLARVPSSVVGGKEPRITLVVEGRRKFFDPPLSASYCGNCISPFLPTNIPVKELAEMPVASIACGIRQQLETTKREEWLAEERWKGMFAEFESGQCVFTSITSSFKSPLYEIDFGFGKPLFARRVSTLWNYSRPEMFVGTASIAPPAPSDSSSTVAVLSVFALPEVLQALETDPIFLSLFAPQ